MHNPVPSKIYHFTRTRIKHFPLHFPFYHSIYSHEIKQSYYLQDFDSNWEFRNKKKSEYIRWYDMVCLWWELKTTFSFSAPSNLGFKTLSSHENKTAPKKVLSWLMVTAVFDVITLSRNMSPFSKYCKPIILHVFSFALKKTEMSLCS